MSIALLKLQPSSERFLLVRLNPARYVEPIHGSGSSYSMLFPWPVNRLERNGVALTKVSTITAVDQWTFSESTMTLTVWLTAAPSPSTNVLIAYYYIYLTGEVGRQAYETPTDPTSTLREWQPRLTTYPTFSQSFENQLNGVFTIADTQIDIINEAGQFQAYLTANDSFYNKNVDIWLCMENISNIEQMFTGTMRSISMTNNTLTIDCVDKFNRLNQTALMGDTADEAYFQVNTIAWPDLDPAADNKTVPYIVGAYSRFNTTLYSADSSLPQFFVFNEGTQAWCTDYSGLASGTTNLHWGCCRLKGNVATQVFGTVTAFDNFTEFESDGVTIRFGYLMLAISSYSNVQVGDTLRTDETSGGITASQYLNIVYTTPFVYSGVTYNLLARAPGFGPFYNLGLSSLFPLPSFVVQIVGLQNQIDFARYGLNYILNQTATSGGNNYIEIEFGTNSSQTDMPNNFPDASDWLTPTLHRVYFRTSNTVVQTHGDFVAEVLDILGLPYDSSTTAAADAALPANCRFHVPYWDETDYKPYLNYVQDLLTSVIGYLRINPSFIIEYNLISAPSSTDIRDGSVVLTGDTGVDIQYADIATEVIAYNNHCDSLIFPDASAARSNIKAQFLHGITNVNQLVHLLETITGRIDAHMGLASQRQVNYRFSTATLDIDTELGQDLELSNKIVLGSGSVAIKVTSVEKSPAKTVILGTDLLGL